MLVCLQFFEQKVHGVGEFGGVDFDPDGCVFENDDVECGAHDEEVD